MSAAPRFRAATAMQMVGLDRDDFNEAVTSGFFECAPATRPGAPRLFFEDDLVTLAIYKWLLGTGLPPRLAGPYACNAGNFARTEAKDEKLIVFVRGPIGSFFAKGSEYDPKHEGEYMGTGQVEFSGFFHIGTFRARIARKIAEETATFGRDDEA